METNEAILTLNSKYYKQVDGAAMGSTLGPALPNLFLWSFEIRWLRDCHNNFIPVYIDVIFDDIFALFFSPKEYLSSKNVNTNFYV